LFADPDIIRLPGPLAPLQNFIAYFISKRRAPKSRAAYASIGGGSPILQYSNEQARLLHESLESHYGLSVQTYIGMRYWHPFTEEALGAIRADGIEALVILPLVSVHPAVPCGYCKKNFPNIRRNTANWHIPSYPVGMPDPVTSAPWPI